MIQLLAYSIRAGGRGRAGKEGEEKFNKKDNTQFDKTDVGLN